MTTFADAPGASLRAQSSDLDWKIVNTIRVLSAEMVQAANSGHPGAPMGCAPATYVLFKKFLKFNPKNPNFAGRDRFVLSNGHASALIYSLLHLFGYDLTMEDLKAFRQLGSRTPGHPENFVTPGVEVTTGPLGQGISAAVGLAMAESHYGAIYNKHDVQLVDNFTYVMVGDGCLQEGVASEAASLAGHLKLGKLIVLYDDNKIQIDGSTDLAFTEDVRMRFEAYGWQVLSVADGDNDLAGIEAAIRAGQAETTKPTLICVRTTIGYGSAGQGTEKVHGAPLGGAGLTKVKSFFGLDAEKPFHVEEDVRAELAGFIERGAALEADFNKRLEALAAADLALGAEARRRLVGDGAGGSLTPSHTLPAAWLAAIQGVVDGVSDGVTPAIATRKASQMVINALAPVLPELIGGSADLTGSNLNYLDCSHDYQAATPAGRNVRFGVREHAMAAICNGLHAYGGMLPFCATFLNFIGYAQGAYRLSCLSHHQVIYIMTHDSIGLGEDGPTHQPIETLVSLRATPGGLTLRPADVRETAGAYQAAVSFRQGPSVLALSRQNLPQLKGSCHLSVAKGGYLLGEHGSGERVVTLVATGSEVALAEEVAERLAATPGGDLRVRVVSMPCTQLFDQQPLAYRQEVLGGVGAPVVSIEAGSTIGWSRYAHLTVGIDTFGASAPYTEVYQKVGLVPEAIVPRVEAFLKHVQAAGGQAGTLPTLQEF
ncbi:transketolase [Fonticula alba]|uniref:transketolase n=1 Tax=Fonticula alba TaxID=691883 RepID=A0A058Z7H3_FONAL|nr:transketolase [Fonticula alba]KCV70041.1 transketolase [Fonticula alba]|eukprot:XP_009495647.1 transketolase [Fonticula alba]